MNEQPSKTATPRFPKKRFALCVVGTLLMAMIALLVANHDSTPMPVYEGKTAREWMYRLEATDWTRSDEAFKQMGSNAVPFLAHELARKDTLWERFCFWIYPKLPAGIRKHWSTPWPVDIRQMLAANGLVSVNSRTAVPSMLRVMAEGNEAQREYALEVLQPLVKPEDTNLVLQLRPFLNPKQPGLSLNLATILSDLSSGEVAIPCLTNILTGTNHAQALEAFQLLDAIDPANVDKWHEMLTNSQSRTASQPTIAPK